MLEVCFSDSAKGALILAQNCENSYIGGAIGVITNKKGPLSFWVKKKAIKKYKKRQKKLQKLAVSLGGKREDIVSLPFNLSEGDIISPICLADCPEKIKLQKNFFFDRYNNQEETQNAFNEFWANCVADLQKLKSNPSQIRIWLDHTPDAQCGLLFLADLLKNQNTEFHIVELQHQTILESGCSAEYRGWGEVEPELYGTFLSKEKILTPKEVSKLANRWEVLKFENAPLRVVKDDFVISTDTCYYDNLIRREFPKTNCKIALIIGNALAKQKIPTSDIFIAERIRHFIENGELVVLEKEEKGFYDITVMRADRD